jgi:hypothetical protein
MSSVAKKPPRRPAARRNPNPFPVRPEYGELPVFGDSLRQIAKRNRSPSARTNSHLVNTHHYQLTRRVTLQHYITVTRAPAQSL